MQISLTVYYAPSTWVLDGFICWRSITEKPIFKVCKCSGRADPSLMVFTISNGYRGPYSAASYHAAVSELGVVIPLPKNLAPCFTEDFHKDLSCYNSYSVPYPFLIAMFLFDVFVNPAGLVSVAVDTMKILSCSDVIAAVIWNLSLTNVEKELTKLYYFFWHGGSWRNDCSLICFVTRIILKLC